MSWLARSFANTLGIDDDNSNDNSDLPNPFPGDAESSSFSKRQIPGQPEGEEKGGEELLEEEDADEVDEVGDQPDSPTRRVKEDLTELRETLTRQLWGVASFLAPPPASMVSKRNPDSVCNPRESSDPSVSGYDESSSDRLKVGGRYLDGISSRDREGMEKQSFVGRYHRFGSVNEDDNWTGKAVGVTDEVLTFAGNIAHHPETWLDFPIEEEDDLDDFCMSETQKVHALAVESLTPGLAALRIELCPAHMSIGYFWKVYFVLLHSRLNKQDAELLSTTQVVEARAKWMLELQKRNKMESGWHSPKYYKGSDNFSHEDSIVSSAHSEHQESMHQWTNASEVGSSPTTVDSESERHLFASNEIQFIDRSSAEEKTAHKTVEKHIPYYPSPRIILPNFGDDDDDWPEDDVSGPRNSISAIPVGIDEDVSFSDLEDDDWSLPVKPKVGSKVNM